MTGAQIKPKPWYRETPVWWLIAPPAFSIAAGIAMLYLAIASNDGLVVDDYYKQGKAINQVLRRDEAARAYRAHAQLTLTGNEAALTLAGTMPPAAAMRLKLLHATRDVHDVTLTLARTADANYRATLPPLAPGRWYVQLDGGDWRLLGSLSVPQERRVTLAPQ